MNKQSKIRAGLSFGVGMTIFFLMQDLLIQDHFTLNEFLRSAVSAFVSGTVSGLLFGWLFGVFANSGFVIQATPIHIAPDETILFETGANHFKGMEGVGGRMYLTNKRLVFKSHRLNVQEQQLSFYLEDIGKVETYKTLGVVNNGLSITTNNEKTEKFVVDQQSEWIKKLTEKKPCFSENV